MSTTENHIDATKKGSYLQLAANRPFATTKAIQPMSLQQRYLILTYNQI